MSFHPPRTTLAAFAILLTLSLPAPAQTVLYRCTDGDGNLTIQSDPCPPGTQQRKQVVNDLPSAPAATPAPAPTRALPEPEWQLPSTQAPAPDNRPDFPPATGALTPANIPLPEPGQSLVREKPLEVITDNGDTEYRVLDSGTPLAERKALPAGDRASGEADNLPPPPPLQACVSWDKELRYQETGGEPPRRCMPLQTTGLGGQSGFGAGSACEMITDTCTAVPDEQLCDAWLRRLRDEQAQLVFARSDDPAATRAEIERIEAMLADSRCGPAR